jgi:hypothetical protein
MNWSDAIEILKNFRNWRVLACERKPISPIGLGTSRLSRSELPRLLRWRSYAQIAEGIQ